MEQIAVRRPRLNVFGRAARTRRIFGRLREGWAYDEIAQDEGVSAERIRQIVSDTLNRRVIDQGSDHARLQLERLAPALRLAGEAVTRGELKAIAPLLKVIDRLDRHQTTMIAKYEYGPADRQKLLDKLNRMARNLGYDKELIAAAPEDAEADDDAELG